MRAIERLQGLVLLLILFLPMAYMPLDNAEPFKVPEEAIIVSLGCLFVLLVEGQRAYQGMLPFGGAPLATCRRWVLALAGWIALTSFLGVNPGASWAYAGTVFTFFALGHAVVDWLEGGNARRRNFLVGAIAAVLAVQTVLSFMQHWHFGFVDFGRSVHWGDYFVGYMAVLGATASAGAPIGTLGNVNYLGEYLALVLPAVVGWALAIHNLRARVVAVATLLVPLVLLVMTGCRAAVLGILVVCPIAAVLAFGWSSLDPRRWLATRGGKVATGAVGVVLVGVVAVAGKLLLAKIRVVSATEEDVQARTINWHAANAIWRDHPVNGAGLGGFKLLDVDKLRLLFPNGLPKSGAGARFYEAHNEPIQVMAELGIVGLLLVALAFFDWVADVRGNESMPVTARFGLMWGVGALLVASSFGFPFHIPITALNVTLIIALGIARPRTEHVEEAVAVSSPALAVATVAVLAIAGGLEIGLNAWPLFQAYHEQYLASQAMDRGDFASADQLYHDALRDNRFKGTVLTQAIISCWRSRRFQEMVDLYDTYATQGAGMDALTMKGDALAELGRKDEALKAYNQVIHYYSPDHPNYQRAASQIQRLTTLGHP